MSLKTRSNWMRIAVAAGVSLLLFPWDQADAWQGGPPPGNPALTTYTVTTTPGSTVVSIEMDFKYDFDSAIYVVGPTGNRVKYAIDKPQQGSYTMQTDVADSGATTTQFASIVFYQYKGGHSEHYGEFFFMVDGSGTAYQSAAPVIGAQWMTGKSMSIPIYPCVDAQFSFLDRVTCESGPQCSTCQISAGTSIPGTGGGICVSPDPANGNILTVSNLLRLDSSGGGCTSCGGGSPAKAIGGLDFSASTQTQAIAQTSDLGPMHASNWCTKLEFYESGMYYFGHTIYLYRADVGGSVAFTRQPFIDPAGVYSCSTRSEKLKLYNGTTLTDMLSDVTRAVLYPDQGGEVEFEVTNIGNDQDGNNNDGDYVFYCGRLKSITDRNGYATTVAYKFATPQSDSRTKWWQMDTVTDPSSRVVSFTYQALQQFGRWSLASMSSGGTTINFDYEDGFLKEIQRPDGANTVCTFTQDNPNNVGLIDWFDPTSNERGQRDCSITITLDYLLSEDGDNIINQPFGNPISKTDGAGQPVFAIYKSSSDPNASRAIVHGRLVEYSLGVSARVYETWALDPNNQTYSGFSGTAETSYARISVGGLPAAQNGMPAEVYDRQGEKYQFLYDTQGFITKKTYPGDGTFEKWDYNSFQQPTRYRDRLGRVTKYEYDTRGNLTKKKVGILEISGNDVNQPEYAEYTYDYYPAGHVNQYLLKTEFDPLYNPAQSDLHRTDYEYDAKDLLTKKIEAADATGSARPETIYTYNAAGLLATSTDPQGRTASYTYDLLGRQVQVAYSDGSSEQTLYGDGASPSPGLVVKTKDRADVVTEYVFDANGRRTATIVGAAIDTNILDGQADDQPITDPSQQIVTTYLYHPVSGDLISQITDGKLTEYDHDYRGRVIATHTHPNADTELISRTHYDTKHRVFHTEDPYGRREYLGYRASDGDLIRRVQGTQAAFTLADNSAVLSLTRDLTFNASYIVAEAIKNAEGEPEQFINGRGIVSKFEYDSIGQLFRVTQAEGTGVEALGELDYDLAGNVVEVRSPRYFDTSDAENGNVRTAFAYNGRNLLASRTEAPGTSVEAVTEFTYYQDGRPNTTTDALTNEWAAYWHSCCGRFQGSTDPLGHGSIFNNDYRGQVTHAATVSDYHSQTNKHDPNSSDTLSEATARYDELGRPIAVTTWLVPRGVVDPNAPPVAGLNGVSQADGLTARRIYDSNLTDGIGLDAGINVAKLGGGTFSLSLANCLAKLADPVANGGADTSFANNSAGSAVVSINAEEEISVAISDALGRTVMTAAIESYDGNNPNGLIVWTCRRFTTSNLAGFGDCFYVESIDVQGNTIGVQIDGAGRALSSKDQQGNISTFKYDANGNLRERRDANSVGFDIVYDERDRITERTDTHGETVKTAYDRSSNVIQVTDAKQEHSSIVYDARNRKKTITDRVSGVTTYAYDATGNLKSVTDAETQETSYEYDPRGLLVWETFPDHTGGTWGDAAYGKRQYTYDDSGALKSLRDQSGDSITNIHDLAGRMTFRQYRAGGVDPVTDIDSYTYDAASRMLTADSGRYGNTVTNTFDVHGRPHTQSLTVGGQTYTTTPGYDAHGRLSDLLYPDGSSVERTYTSRQQLHQVTYNGNVVDTRTYDPGGRPKKSTYGNAVATVYTYFNDNNIKSITTNLALLVPLESSTYAYDANKNVASETISGVMSGYGFSTGATGFDEEDRLKNWNRSDSDLDQSWNLTQVGDWDDMTVNSVLEDYTQSAAHQLDAIENDQLEHDVKGNVTKNRNGHQYQWDFDDMLRSVDTDNDSTADVTFTYDALGRRVSRDDGTNHVVFVSFGHQVIADYPYGAASTSPAEKYVYASYIDEPILKDGTGGILYYHRNRQYSIVAMSDTTGVVVERYAYDAHGVPTILNGLATKIRTSSHVGNEYLFTGRRYDSELSIYYFRARYYDASIGQFLSRDPLGYVDGMSLYRGYFIPGGHDPFGLEGRYGTNWNPLNWGWNVGWYLFDGTAKYECDIAHSYGAGSQYKAQNNALDRISKGVDADSTAFDDYFNARLPSDQQIERAKRWATIAYEYQMTTAGLASGVGVSGSLGDDAIRYSTDKGLVKAADEVLEQAIRNGPEAIAGFKIYGNKGLVGNSYARNIFLIEAEKKGASGLRGLVNALETEARAAGAKELRIVGHAVHNKGFLNARLAERFGFEFRTINNETIELLKVFN